MVLFRTDEFNIYKIQSYICLSTGHYKDAKNVRKCYLMDVLPYLLLSVCYDFDRNYFLKCLIGFQRFFKKKEAVGKQQLLFNNFELFRFYSNKTF